MGMGLDLQAAAQELATNTAPRTRARAMLDIETLDTGPEAVVTSIGIAMFDDESILSITRMQLDYSDDKGTINPRTVRWWLTQEGETIRGNLLGVVPPARAARVCRELLKGATEVWANSPSFDCTILRNWYKRLGMDCPWHFRVERDCRTVFAYGRLLSVPWPGNEQKHDAGADAVCQAKYLIATEHALGVNR